MKTALATFPPDYLHSISTYQLSSSASTEDSLEIEHLRSPSFNEELRMKMDKFFKDECTVYESDDPALTVLEEAIANIDSKVGINSGTV